MNAPKCIFCLNDNKIAQTYKVAGKPFYQCHDCGALIAKRTFEEEDFMWKDNPKTWKKKHNFSANRKIVNEVLKKHKAKVIK